jgi:hypothetical protein
MGQDAGRDRSPGLVIKNGEDTRRTGTAQSAQRPVSTGTELARLFCRPGTWPSPNAFAWGLLVAYLVDPSGVLWHLAQQRDGAVHA